LKIQNHNLLKIITHLKDLIDLV